MSRRLDLSQFRGDDSDDETEQFLPKRQLALNELKSKTFSHGITKKSKKDLEREAEERKRKEEEEALALVNAEMEEVFAAPGSGPTMIGNFGRRPIGPGGGFVRAGGAGPSVPYEPPRGPAAMAIPPKGPSAMGYARPFRPPPKAPSPPPSAGQKPKGKRAMDSFLEEIKNNQQLREDRLGKMAKTEGSSVTALAAWEHAPAARAMAEAESNLPNTITEESLGLFFAKQGPVGTVKIMWPRGDDESARRGRAGLTGFVSYMTRKDAEKAVEQLDGLDWGGFVLRILFSKPVPMPQKALYDITTNKGKRDRSPSPRGASSKAKRFSRDRSNSPSRSPPSRRRRSRSLSDSRSPPRRRDSYSRSPSRTPPPKKASAREKWLSRVSAEQEKFIKAVASKVKEHGQGFEDVLRDREKENAKFTFLFDAKLPEYHLYQYALSSKYRFPTPPPDAFEDEGYASLYSSDSAEDSEKERTVKGKMGKLARRRFEAMLRAMTGKRSEIARAMEFAMTRAEAADEIAEVICQSLRLDGTPVPRKIARLHLVSDILHNSASPLPNVWKYRLAFERRLPPVFAHLAGVHQSLLAYSGRISADVFKQQVGAVLEIWERWIVFTQDVSEFLRGLLDGTIKLEAKEEKAAKEAAETVVSMTEEKCEDSAKFKTSGFKSSFKPLEPLKAPPITEDVDGEAMEEDKEDLDGEAIDDLDGEAMDEDLDGETM